MKKIIFVILILGISSLCYGQDDFETENVYPSFYPAPAIWIRLGLYECSCTVNDIDSTPLQVWISLRFMIAPFEGFRINCYAPDGSFDLFSFPYLPSGPFIIIFKPGETNGYGFRFMENILVKIEYEAHPVLRKIECYGNRISR
jgi:hypothetical protein